MKVGIINFHYAHNYGAVLECVALKSFVEELGNEVEIINYRPLYGTAQYAVHPSLIEYGKRAYRDFADSNSFYRLYRVVRRVVQAIIRQFDASKRKKRKAAYDFFIQKNNIRQSKQYFCIEELRKDPPMCEVYISGSDQIWNPYVTNAGLDEAYFLNFGSDSIKRIAYAVSPCQLDLVKYKEQIKTLLKKYNAISLRESQYCEGLKQVLGRNIEVCIDPTLLYDIDFYNSIEEIPDICPEEFILVYGFPDKISPGLLEQVALFVQAKTMLPIVDVSGVKLLKGNNRIYIESASPGEFLHYIKRARYVVTNSFHGTAFSILYKKAFFSVERKETKYRVWELLDKIELTSRYISDYDENMILKGIDYIPQFSEADIYLIQERAKARDFLKSSIQ